LAVMLFPVYWMVNTSLQSGNVGASSTLLPLHPTLAAYRLALSQQGGDIVTSLTISCGTVLLSLAIAAPAAYVLAKSRIRGRSVILLALVITQMVPGIVIANSLYPAFNQLGLLNSRLGLVLADTSTALPFAILIMRAFMVSLPGEIIEAARVDGAGLVRTFVSIVLPVSRNAVITAGLFAFLFSWSDFLFALTLTTGTNLTPVTLGIYSYLGGEIQSWGPVMATGVLSALPAIVLVLALTVAAFTGMVRAAVVRGETAASWQATGADVVVAAPAQLGISPAAVRAIAAVPGVQHAASVVTFPLTTADNGHVVDAIVVDPASYAALVASTEGFSPVRPALLTPTRGQGAIPVLASPQAVAYLGGRGGSTFDEQEGLPALRVQVSGELQSTPALPAGGAFIVLPVSAIRGVSEPLPLGVLIDVQVPALTSFQALP